MLGKKTDEEKGQNKALLWGGRHRTLEHRMQWGSLAMFFPESQTFAPSLGPTSPWTPLPSPALEVWTANCSWDAISSSHWNVNVPWMSHGWLQVLEGWFDSSWQKNLPRKGGKLLFFTHFVSHASRLASIGFCVFSHWEISIASWNLKHQCHTKCILTQAAATIPWVWREGFNKGK